MRAGGVYKATVGAGEGAAGDVLVVAGDPVADIAVLQDRSKFIAVMQGGIVKAGRLTQPGWTGNS